MILGRFRSPLGVIFLVLLMVFNGFRDFLFISLQEPSWTELGSIWVDFGLPNGSKMRPKSDQKRSKKDVDL